MPNWKKGLTVCIYQPGNSFDIFFLEYRDFFIMQDDQPSQFAQDYPVLTLKFSCLEKLFPGKQKVQMAMGVES